MKVKLISNPFLKENTIHINGEEYNKDSVLNKYRELYVYQFGEDFVYDLINELNTNSFSIEFDGSLYDYLELEGILSKTTKGKSINITLVEGKIIKDLDRREKIDKLSLLIKESSIKEFKEADLFNKIDEILNREIEVAVIAPMSSGKSTLINSIVGKKLMPSKSEACTATIVTLKHSENAKEFTIVKKNNKPCNEKATVDNLIKLNDDNKIDNIYLEGKIIGLDGIKNIKIVDTPGPNNAANQEHKKATYRYIKGASKPIILFLIDKDQLTSEAVAELVRTVADEMKRDGKVDEDRFIFVVNKCDSLKDEDNMESISSNTRNFLIGCGVKNPRIHFVSAYNALLARLIMNNQELSKLEESSYEQSIKCVTEGLFTFYKDAIFENRLKEKLIIDIEKASKELEKSSEAKAEYDKLVAQKEAVECMIASGAMPEEMLKPQLEKIEKDKAEKASLVEEYRNHAANLVYLTSGIAGLEANIKDVVNKHLSVRLVEDIITQCRNTIEAQGVKKKISQSIMGNQEEKRKILENIKEVEEKLNNKEIIDGFKSEINGLKFGDSFKNIVNRVNKESREFSKKVNSLAEKKVNSSSTVLSFLSMYNKPKETQKNAVYVDRKDAKKFLDELNNKTLSLKADIETEYERFIEVDIRKVGNTIIAKYKKSLEDILGEVKGLDSSVSNLINLSLPNYDEFLKRKTEKKTETYTTTISNPAREGFFGKLKFWQPKTIEVDRTRDVSVVDKEELKAFAESLATLVISTVDEMRKAAESEKIAVKNNLTENMDLLKVKIDENVELLKLMLAETDTISKNIKEDEKLEKELNGILDMLNSIISI